MNYPAETGGIFQRLQGIEPKLLSPASCFVLFSSVFPSANRPGPSAFFYSMTQAIHGLRPAGATKERPIRLSCRIVPSCPSVPLCLCDSDPFSTIDLVQSLTACII